MVFVITRLPGFAVYSSSNATVVVPPFSTLALVLLPSVTSPLLTAYFTTTVFPSMVDTLSSTVYSPAATSLSSRLYLPSLSFVNCFSVYSVAFPLGSVTLNFSAPSASSAVTAPLMVFVITSLPFSPPTGVLGIPIWSPVMA